MQACYRFATCYVAVLLAERRMAPGLRIAAALPHRMGAGGLLSDGELTEEMLSPILHDLMGRGYSSLLLRPNPLQSDALRSCHVLGWRTRRLAS